MPYAGASVDCVTTMKTPVAWIGLSLAGLLLGPLACQEPNPEFDGAAGSASSSEGSSGAAPTSSGPATTSGMDGTGSTSSPGGTTSDTVGTSTGDTAEPTTAVEGSSSGGDELPYPPCTLDQDPVCPLPYEECYDLLVPDYTVCTMPCQEDGECPVPTSGDAVPVCAGQNDDQCVLECAGGATCPDGMECQMAGPAGMFERCVWPS